MATGDIKIGIDIVSNTKQETKEALKLKQAYEGAASAASKMAGTAGSRAVAAKAAPASGGLSGQQYGTAQGTTGMGSSARDFAKEAQGLGGLVRVYATFAANLFAVSAAFTALRDAASTENIVKGLDQLGAASGRSLGNLSKQLVAASDGAISLRDSMTAVAQASSGGLSNKQILQLGEVAKKTSEALGLSMPDAISRLSRGITKIEPELLDELGIFVKVNEASSTYALSIGKSAASLSDFEKRQAFANAVLDQGIKKFADIKIDANPYDKLLASMNNVATTGLQLVNKVLGPIASVLSESPGALAGVFGLIAMTLLKQAIPALSQWRGELAKSAETAAESAKRSYESYRDYSITKALEKEASVVAPLQKQINDKIVSARDDLAKVLSSKSKILARAGASEVDPEAMQKSLATEEKRRQTAIASLEAQKQADIAQGTATAAKLVAYDTMAQKQHEEIIGIQSASKAYKDAAEARQKIADAEIQSEKPTGSEKLRKMSADRAQAVAASKGILSRVGTDSELKGMGNAFKYLFDNIKNGVPDVDNFGNVLKDQDGKIIRATEGLKGFRAATTAVSGSFLAVGDAIGRTLSAISPYLQLIGLLITAYQLFDSYASKAAKEQTEFNTKISEGESAIKTVTSTFDLYVRKTKDAFTVQGIVAFTTALAGVSDSLDSQLLAYDKYKQVAGTFDKLKDSMAGFFFFTESNLEKLQKSTVESVQGVIKSLELSGKSNTQKGIIAEALFGKDASIDKLYGSTKDLNKAFDGLSGSEREEKIKRVAGAIDLVTKSEQYSTNAAQAFQESLNSINKTVDQIIQANAFTDLQGKLGVDLVLAAERFGQALSDPVKGLASIANLAKDPKALAALGNVDITNLQQAVVLQNQLNDAEKARADALDKQEKAKAGTGPLAQGVIEKMPTRFSQYNPLNYGLISGAKQADIAEADKKVEKTKKDFDDLKRQAADFSLQQIGLVTKIAEAGFAKIEIGLKKAKEQADLGVAKVATGISASGGANVADRNYAIRISELKIQESLIDANYAVQLASIENSQKLDELSTQLQLATAAQMKTSSESEVKSAGEALFKAASQRLQVIFAANTIKTGGMTDAMKMRSITPEILGAANARVNETVMAKKQAAAAKAGVQGQYTEAGLARDAENRSEGLRTTKEALDLDNQRLNTQNESLNLASKILGYDTASLVQEKQSVQQKLIINDTAAKLAEIEKDRQNSLVDAKGDQIKEIEQRAKDRSEAVTNAADMKKYTTDLLEIQQLGLAAQSDITRESAKNLEKLRLTNSVEEARLSNLQAELGFKQQLGLIDERSANAQKAAYETNLLRLKSSEEEAKINADIELKQRALDDAKALASAAGTAIRRGTATPEQQAAATVVNNAQSALDLSKQQLTTLGQRTTLQQTQIDQAKMYNDELIKQKQHLADINANTQALATVFGDIGQKIGEAAAAMDAFAKSSADRLAQEANAKPDDLDALKKKNAKDRLSDISTLANAQKKLFKEETVAYKAISAIEKGASLERIALKVKEAGFSADNLAEQWNNAKKWMGSVGDMIQKDGIAAVVKQGIAGDPWTAIPRMIAMAQFMSSLTGQSIAGPPPVDQGTLAGTGQQVGADGQTIGVRQGGVLGDPKAEAKSITDSLDILGKIFFDNMGAGSSSLIMHLKAIQDNTGNTAKALNATGVLSGGNNPFGINTGESSPFGNGILGILGESILGGKTSTTVTGAGYRGGGTLADLASGAAGFEGYSNVRQETSGGLFGLLPGSSADFTIGNKLDPNVNKAIQGVFKSFNAALGDIGSAFGVTESQMNDFYRSQKATIQISTQNLTATESRQKLIAELSVQQNKAVEDLIPWITTYMQAGDEAATVAAKLLKDGETVVYGLKMVGKSVVGLADKTEEGVAKQQLIIKNFGGTADEYAAAISKYYDVLFSASEKSAFATSSVEEQLALLGYTGVTTNKQLKDLIATIDPTTKLYADLIKLVPAFTDATAAAKAYVNSINDQEAAIYTLLGNPTKALEISRAKEFDALEESLRPRQLYINALTDETALRDKLKAAYNSSNTALATSIKTLTDYKTALTAGAASTLTPAEKYAQAKSIFMQTAAAAQAVITASSSATDIAARDAALAKIQSTGDALLGASREVNASGAQYASDFESVTSAIDSTIGTLSTQKTAQEQQLSYLQVTADSTKTMAELLGDYLKAQQATIDARTGAISAGSDAASVGQYANGGIARGLSIVGERGPELVDFATPSRVYSNQASNDLFNTKELVAEIKALREEVCQLRDDQNKQTGAIIDTTIQANVQNAQMIATANQNMTNQQDWKNRSQVRVA